MKRYKFLIAYSWAAFFLVLLVWRCQESPVYSDLSESNIFLNDTTFHHIQARSYWTSPELGLADRLYFGSKNNISAFNNLFEMSKSSSSWSYFLDSNVVIDSAYFFIFSNDSIISIDRNLDLYFSSDSHFSESNSTNSDFDNFNLSEWNYNGFGNGNIELDTLGDFIKSSVKWDISNLIETIIDTSDTNFFRSFLIKYNSTDSTFYTFYSRQATSSLSPQIKFYYRFFDGDSIDTTTFTYYASKDLTIIEGLNLNVADTSDFGISLGLGQRMLLDIDFSLPKGSLIKSANLFLFQDTLYSNDGHKIIIDPISSILDTNIIYFDTDPYLTLGYPSAMYGTLYNDTLKLSMKEFLQSIILDNDQNTGFKVLSSTANDPFEKIKFSFNDDNLKPFLEVIYAKSN